MPTKPPFDPNLHLLNPRTQREVRQRRIPDNDEDLARRLQEEILAEELREEMRVESARNNANRERERSQELKDEEFARRLQFEDEDGTDEGLRHLEDIQRQTGITDQLEYARSLQQQALRDVQPSPTPRESQPQPSERTSNETARLTGDHRRTQAEEDRRIAQFMSETGQSLRDLDLRNLPQASNNPALNSMPGAHSVQFPASFSPALMQANPQPQRAIKKENVNRDSPLQAEVVPGYRTTDASNAVPPARRPRPLMWQDDPDGANGVARLPSDMIDMDNINPDGLSLRSKPKGRKGIRGFGKKSKAPIPPPIPPKPRKPSIQVSILPPSRKKPGPVPYSVQDSRLVPIPLEAPRPTKKKQSTTRPNAPIHTCSACQKPATHYLVALDKRYHKECFRCMGCHNVIDARSSFAYIEEGGEKHPLHKECFSELYGVKCVVCKNAISPGPDGKVSFVKHPFFDSEQMCPSHAANPGRRCTGCHRFEPVNEPFADLGDVGRVVCYSCCRTVVVDSADAEPLWTMVVEFLEKKLNLPIWPDIRDVPILVSGYKSLNEQMKQSGGVHGGSSQIMTRGVCLTEHQSGRKLKVTKLRFNKERKSFTKADAEESGFTFFQVPDAHKVNPDSSVTCILCLSGLPRDLTASVLAHEATHAWIKLHPSYDVDEPLPPLVEEGCAQLIAALFLREGLPPASDETYGDGGPSEEKLRQYFRYSIETDNHEIYGEGYRQAATVYSAIGIEALMSHVVLYKNFPSI